MINQATDLQDAQDLTDAAISAALERELERATGPAQA
jgi:hypothetical protein